MSSPDAARQNPDEHWIAERAGRCLASASLWWKKAPSLPGERVGVIGHYFADYDEAAAALLEHAEHRLRAAGCTVAVGPMDGNTWRAYRFVTEPGVEPPFFLEPWNPPSWPAQWRAAGYATLASYYSSATTRLNASRALMERIGRHLQSEGVQLRPLRPDRFQNELRLLHALSMSSFGSNFLYSPLAVEEFLEQGAALRKRLRPELILIAEKNQQPVGFVFALPDWLGPAGSMQTAIIKTVAVLPEHRRSGLGGWLVYRVQRSAHELGFSRVIHALMHEHNPSVKVSARYAQVFRKYELFGKQLHEPRRTVGGPGGDIPGRPRAH